MVKLLYTVVRVFLSAMLAMGTVCIISWYSDFSHYINTDLQIKMFVVLLIIVIVVFSVLFYRIIPFGKDKNWIRIRKNHTILFRMDSFNYYILCFISVISFD